MLNRIFPKRLDNRYRGHWLALWLFVLVVLLRFSQGVDSIAFTHKVATTADAIPLDSYGAAAAATVVALFALLGLYLSILPVLGIIVLVRYRAMIPLVYLLMLAVMIASRIVVLLHPTETTGSVSIGSAVNLGILAALAVGFVLSLTGKAYAQAVNGSD
jgi:hypothetical protein